jgi:tol-pal system protein YbgF
MKRLFGFMLSGVIICHPCFAETPDESIDEYVLAAEDPGEPTPEEKDPADQVTPEDLQRIRDEQQGAVRTLDEDFRQLKEAFQQQRKELEALQAKLASHASNPDPQKARTISSSDSDFDLDSNQDSDEETESILKLLEESAPLDVVNSPQKKDINAVRNAATKKAAAAPTPKLPTGNAQAQYNEAFALYEKGAYKQAEKAFNYFLATYSKDPLAAKAIYWKAECCLAQGKTKEAKILFITAYKKEPKGQKAPDCLFKLGQTLANQGKKGDACIAWKKLASDFPNMSKEMKDALATARKKYKCG